MSSEWSRGERANRSPLPTTALDEAGYIKLHAPQKYDSLEKEASHLRATQPKVLGAAHSTARALSARADLICIASVGQTCGCEKRCLAPSELHSREKKSKMKEATQVIKSVESHSDDAGHDDDDDENGGGKREAEER